MAKARLIGGRWRPTGRTLGEGGQGQILLVTDANGQTDAEFALKLLKNVGRTDRLAREIRTAASLARSGAPILPILDDYLSSDPEALRPWYVSPLLAGGRSWAIPS